MFELHFAPLQGYTEKAYRNAHFKYCGGVDCYYTPFLRLENGKVRKKDALDLVGYEKEAGMRLVPQIIASNVDEFSKLADFVAENGFLELNLNACCPYPMQTKLGRGAALLSNLNEFSKILKEISNRPELSVSVKMRLGIDSSSASFLLLPLLNDANISHVILHPRLGKDLYKGTPDMESFSRFYENCKHKLIYNGDLQNIKQIDLLRARFPKLSGVMLGRGLLSCPSLAMEYRSGKIWSKEHRITLVENIHNALLASAKERLQGDAQILLHLKPFFEYQKEFFSKKTLKKVIKANSLPLYEEAVQEMFLSAKTSI